MVEGILAGISLEGKGLESDLEGLESALNKTGEAAKKVEFVFGGEDEFQAAELEKAIETVNKATAAFNPLRVAVDKARNQVVDLENALATFEQLGLDTTNVEELLNQARSNEIDALNKLNGVTEEATGGFESLKQDR